jgi:Tol biopolymer transport system component
MHSPRFTLILAALISSARMLPGQLPKPDSLPGYSKLLSIRNVVRFDHPRLSPDGRWLAYSAISNGNGPNIWAIRASGGTPVQITSGDHSDARPLWVGTRNDRILFWSNRTGGLLMIDLDPATMKPKGMPKGVTTDSTGIFKFDVSPDGSSIAYAVSTTDSTNEIRVIPALGGPPRMLVRLAGVANFVRFDSTGRFVYFVRNPGGAPLPGGEQPPRFIERVGTSGGAATTVQTVRGLAGGVSVDPIANRVALRQGSLVRLFTLTGDTVGTMPFTNGIATIGSIAFTRDGSSAMVASVTTTTALDAVPLDGSPLVSLTDTAEYYWPDQVVGGRAYFHSSGDVGRFVSLDGKQRGRLPLTLPRDIRGAAARISAYEVAPSGQWMVYQAAMNNGDTLGFIYDIQTKKTIELGKVHQKVLPLQLSTPGDSYSTFLGDEYLYSQWNGDKAEVHALNRQGSSRLVRSLAMTKTEGRAIAFAPGKVAERFKDGQGTHMDVTIGNGKPVRVFTIPNGTVVEMAFSPDGSKLFTTVWDKSLSTEIKERAAFFSTRSEADLRDQPIWITSPDETYHYAWTPDGQAVIAFGENQVGTRTSIWRYRPVAGSQPELVSRRETSIYWDYAMSPDGKYVVVGAERNLGVTVWKADLKKVVKR